MHEGGVSNVFIQVEFANVCQRQLKILSFTIYLTLKYVHRNVCTLFNVYVTFSDYIQYISV